MTEDWLRSSRTVAGYFWRQVHRQPHSIALSFCHARRQVDWTWKVLAENVSLVAEWLAPKLSEPRHVASSLENSPAWIALDLAAHSIGAVHVALDPRIPESSRNELVQRSEASLWVRLNYDESSGPVTRLQGYGPAGNEFEPLSPSGRFASGAREFLGRAWSEPQAEGPASLLFTSGSAGESKGVLLSHRNLLSNALAKLEAAPQFQRDVRLNVLPFCHAYARTCELSAWLIAGGHLVLADDWMHALELAPRYRPTLMNLVPHLASKTADVLEANPQALGGRLRLLQVGGAALEDELWQRLERHGVPPLQGYGLTEASPVVCSNRAGSQQPRVVGPPVAGVETRIDTDGVLWCRGDNVMLGYWRAFEATRRVLRDGWLCTGDRVRVQSDGAIEILGRAGSQIVLSTGHKLQPEPLESELQKLPGVAQALVCGRGRPYPVMLLWADGVTRDGDLLPSILQAWIERQRKLRAAYSIPTAYHLFERPLIDSRLVTVKGSLRRTLVEARYHREIEQLYRNEPIGKL